MDELTITAGVASTVEFRRSDPVCPADVPAKLSVAPSGWEPMRILQYHDRDLERNVLSVGAANPTPAYYDHGERCIIIWRVVSVH